MDGEGRWNVKCCNKIEYLDYNFAEIKQKGLMRVESTKLQSKVKVVTLRRDELGLLELDSTRDIFIILMFEVVEEDIIFM